MCGLVGIVTRYGDSPAASAGVLNAMRGRLHHRGPDAVGALIEANIAFGHTRLAVIDLSASGQQPMQSAGGRHTLVYNGELYNDTELRGTLQASGAMFRSSCDAETVLHLLEDRGAEAFSAMRGMFAVAWHDSHAQRLVLARDPLGIKPLYYWKGMLGGSLQVVFASEPQAILAHPGISAKPCLTSISGYLTTIRTVQGSRTLFEGIHAVEPGECICFDLRSEDLRERRTRLGFTVGDMSGVDEHDAVSLTRTVVTDSVVRHTRSDVPMCSLLSGGLDSTVIAHVAQSQVGDLHTYCAGCPTGASDDDLAMAAEVAHAIGVVHTSVTIRQDLFLDRWMEMIGRLRVPLSTPNEVAINEVSRRLRADGFTVALSGEGADEFFAGYDGPLAMVRDFLLANPKASVRERAAFELETNGWVAPSVKVGLLRPSILAAVSQDDDLLDWQQGMLRDCDDASGGDSQGVDERLSAHLRLQQRVNLVGLLGRLDTATMLESVEGRTPIADMAVAQVAGGIPIGQKIMWDGERVLTKIPLRDAFASAIPRVAVERAKASFPLPFTEWIGPMAVVLKESALLESMFQSGVVEVVSQKPAELWRLAWPMMNLALWERAVWGHEKRPGVLKDDAVVVSCD